MAYPSSSLSNESLAAILDEVIAMARSGRSIATGFGLLDDPSLGSVGRAAREVRQRILTGEPADTVIASLSPEHSAVIIVAMRQLTKTGSTAPMQEAVTEIRRAHWHRSQARQAAINPVINLFFATTITLLALAHWFANGRAPSTPSSYQPSHLMGLMQSISHAMWIAPVIGAVVAFGFWMVMTWPSGLGRGRNGRSRDGRIGSHRSTRREARFCRWLATMIGCDADVPTAVAASSTAADNATSNDSSSWKRSWQSVADKLQAGHDRTSDLGLPDSVHDDTRQCVIDLANGSRSAEDIREDLRFQAAWLERRSETTWRWWAIWLPIAISATMILAMICVLLFTTLRPLVQEIVELQR